MSINYAWVETGHPNCRRPDKVIDARHTGNVPRVDECMDEAVNVRCA